MPQKLYLSASNNRGVLKLPVESKHKYYGNNPSAVDGSITWRAPTNYTSVWPEEGEIALASNISILWNYHEFETTRGTGESEFIGDKITLKTIQFYNKFVIDMARTPLYAPPNATLTSSKSYYENYEFTENADGVINNNQWFRTYRFMLVHFKDNSRFGWDNNNLLTNIAKWFNSIYVPQVYDETNGAADNGFSKLLSNQTKLLRESSPYTGEFKIIKDWIIKIDRTTTSFNLNFKLDPNKDLTMKDPGQTANNWAPTDEWYKNTYLICIGPTSRFDMDPTTWEVIKNNYATINMNELGFYGLRKYTWYDM